MKTNISIDKPFFSYIYSIFLIIEKLAKKKGKTSPAAFFGVLVVFINMGGKISPLYTCKLLGKVYIWQCMEWKRGNYEFGFF